jgi:tetratricopeptide (TPR) repeat protein
VDVVASTIKDEGVAVAAWLEAYPSEERQLKALSGVDDQAPTAEDARRLRSVRAVLRLSLRGLSAEAESLLFALSCFDATIGATAAMLLEVADVAVAQRAETLLELGRLHMRSVVRASDDEGSPGNRYTMHRLMRQVVRSEAGKRLESHHNRFFDLFAAFPEFLSGLISEDRSTDAIMAFRHESANLRQVASTMLGEGSSPSLEPKDLPRKRAEFAVHVNQLASLWWSIGLCRNLLLRGLADATTGEWGWLKANTLQALGDLDRREAKLQDARSRYDEALPIYRDIDARLGEANTLQMLAQTASLEGHDQQAVQGFEEALHLHQQIRDQLGVRADYGYLGWHHLRNGRPRDGLLALEESLQALPREGDPTGYVLSVRGQLQAFSELKDVLGILACLRILANARERGEEQFTNLIAAVKRNMPEADMSELESDLAQDPDSVRRTAVETVRKSGDTNV